MMSLVYQSRHRLVRAMKPQASLHFLAKLYQKTSHTAQRVQHFHFILHGLRVIAQHFLCTLKGESLFFYKMIYCADVVEILSGKLPVTLTVRLWLDDIEFRFPETH